jgi:hypothetical protein
VRDADRICAVLGDQRGDNDTSYSVSVDLFPDKGRDVVYHSIGIAYNVQDINNYDFIRYRYD